MAASSSSSRPRLSPKNLNSTSNEQVNPAANYFSLTTQPQTPGAGHGVEPQTPAFEFGAAQHKQQNPFSPTTQLAGSIFDFNLNSSPSTPKPQPPPSVGSSGANAAFQLGLRGPVSSSYTPLAPPTQTSPFIPKSAQQSGFNFSQQPPSLSMPPPSSRPVLPSKLSGSLSRVGAPSLAASPAKAQPNSRFAPLAPSQLLQLYSPEATSTRLVLDIRTHTTWVASRLAGSINVCVPSTLLRRPAYGVDRIAESLDAEEQATLAKWPNVGTIVVLDADSSVLPEGSGVAALLAKFEKAGFAGTLGWIKGGYGALKLEAKKSELTKQLLASGDTSKATPTSPKPVGTQGFAGFAATGIPPTPGVGGLTSPKKHARPVLQVRDLPVSAFQQASTSTFVHSGQPTGGAGGGGALAAPGTPGASSGSTGSGRPNMGKRRKSANPTPSGLNLDLPSLGMRGMNSATQDALGFSMGTGAGQRSAEAQTPGSSTATGEKRMATNPFFDNIRQNSEALSLSRSLANLSPVELPVIAPQAMSRLPDFLNRLLLLPPLERALLLARQFYDLEVAERERLEGTLNWHANYQGQEGGDDTEEARRFKKFGISAGVELGDLNRFKNIFPYDHARVRLSNRSRGQTDYVNASHVRLAGSPRRFIASQGPLVATFGDFWQMCEQEHVGVIIMLTNLQESGREKCARYWVNRSDCSWDVQSEGGGIADEDITAAGTVSAAPGGGGGGFFGPPTTASTNPDDVASTIRRTLRIRRKTDGVNATALKLRHIQYRAWPDFDIPAQASDVVALVKEVDQAQQDYMREIGWRAEEHEGEEEPPVLAHCSAGVGRTGVFIMVSTMLEQLRRERAKVRAQSKTDATMDIDEQDASGSAPAASPPIPSPSSIISDHTAGLAASLRAQTLESSSPGPSPTAFSFGMNTPATATTTPDTSAAEEAMLGAPSSIKATTRDDKLLRAAVGDEVRSLDSDDPILNGTNEMREQRMSMIANYRQYVCVHECVIAGAVMEMEQEGGW